MSDLVKHQNNGLQVQSTDVFSQPNALQAAENDLLEAINKGVLTCYFELNQVLPNEGDRLILVNKILDSILEKYTGIRAIEISDAFKNGIRKQYGDYFGLSLISFEQFIEGYLKSEERQRKAKEHAKIKDISTEPTPSEKFSTAKGLCLDAYELIKKGRSVGITGTAVYTFLNTLDLIPQDYKKGVMKDAMDALLLEKAADVANSMELLKRRQLNAELESLRMNIANDAINQSQYDEVKRVCKKMILKNVMQDWSVEEVDLSELIETKRDFYLVGHDKAKIKAL